LAVAEQAEATLADEIRKAGPDAPVAILPEGPMTIPYLAPA